MGEAHREPWQRGDLVLLGAVVLLGASFLVRLGAVDITEPDEARYAAVARAMVEGGDYVTPSINGFIYLDKPPLLHWLNALSMRVFGFTAFAARLPSVLAALAAVFITCLIGASMGGRRTGLWAAIVLGTSIMHAGVARFCRYDAVFALALTAALGCVWQAIRNPQTMRWHVAGGVCVGAAILTKGPIGLVLATVALVVFLVLAGSGRAPCKILVVVTEDKDKERFEAVEAEAKKRGYGLFTVADSLGALKKAHTERPDKILVMLREPRFSECHVVRELWADRHTKDIPIASLDDKGASVEMFRSFQAALGSSARSPWAPGVGAPGRSPRLVGRA